MLRVPDLMDPFYDAEDIIRMLLMFGIFGGCYIARVLRGGLQAVDGGQKKQLWHWVCLRFKPNLQ